MAIVWTLNAVMWWLAAASPVIIVTLHIFTVEPGGMYLGLGPSRHHALKHASSSFPDLGSHTCKDCTIRMLASTCP